MVEEKHERVSPGKIAKLLCWIVHSNSAKDSVVTSGCYDIKFKNNLLSLRNLIKIGSTSYFGNKQLLLSKKQLIATADL